MVKIFDKAGQMASPALLSRARALLFACLILGVLPGGLKAQGYAPSGGVDGNPSLGGAISSQRQQLMNNIASTDQAISISSNNIAQIETQIQGCEQTGDASGANAFRQALASAQRELEGFQNQKAREEADLQNLAAEEQRAEEQAGEQAIQQQRQVEAAEAAARQQQAAAVQQEREQQQESRREQAAAQQQQVAQGVVGMLNALTAPQQAPAEDATQAPADESPSSNNDAAGQAAITAQQEQEAAAAQLKQQQDQEAAAAQLRQQQDQATLENGREEFEGLVADLSPGMESDGSFTLSSIASDSASTPAPAPADQSLKAKGNELVDVFAAGDESVSSDTAASQHTYTSATTSLSELADSRSSIGDLVAQGLKAPDQPDAVPSTAENANSKTPPNSVKVAVVLSIPPGDQGPGNAVVTNTSTSSEPIVSHLEDFNDPQKVPEYVEGMVTAPESFAQLAHDLGSITNSLVDFGPDTNQIQQNGASQQQRNPASH